MSVPDLVVRSRRVVTPTSEGPASVHVKDGRILAVAAWDAAPAGARLLDAGEAALMPGVVDTHVHVNEPGRTDWEGFETATRAAAAGGVTTLVDMPLNSIPATTSLPALRAKRDAAASRCWIDVGFWGGVIPGNTEELRPMASGGVLGFKCFLIESGVEEFPFVREKDLLAPMRVLAGIGVPLLVHAELAGPIEDAERAAKAADPRRYDTWLRSRPRAAEDQAIELMARLCAETRARTHVVHHSSASGIDVLAKARARGLPLTAETCPHYLSFAAEEIPDGATSFKCAPPIREAENRERLWNALRDGVLDMITSDHSPCLPALKRPESGDFRAAWGGISSLQLGLSATWSGAAARGFTLRDVVRWMCEAPARLAGLDATKGRIAAGCDADLVVFDPDAKLAVDPARLLHRHSVTPYAGRELRGRVETTILRGELVFTGGDVDPSPRGKLL